MYSYSEWIEDNAAWFSRADRFEGFDRGDILDVDNEIGDATTAEHNGEQTMQKLIDAYRKLPSMANREKLQKYLQKHTMAVCMATPEEIAFLRANEFKGV